MTNSINYKQIEGNITFAARIARAITAIAMLVYPMLAPGSPIDFVALLPLIAIYPMYTAVVGWDPVAFVVALAKAQGKYKQVQIASRVFLFSLGAVMIGATLMLATSAEWLEVYSLMALAAILPICAAIMAENPLLALYESIINLRNSGQIDVEQNIAKDSLSKSDRRADKVPGYDKNTVAHALHKKAA